MMQKEDSLLSTRIAALSSEDSDYYYLHTARDKDLKLCILVHGFACFANSFRVCMLILSVVCLIGSVAWVGLTQCAC